MQRLTRLQEQYNELYDKLGYARNPKTCEAINNLLDKINEEQDKLIQALK